MVSMILSDHRAPINGLLEIIVEGIEGSDAALPADWTLSVRQPDGTGVQVDLFLARSFEPEVSEAGEALVPAGPVHYRGRFAPRLPGTHGVQLLHGGEVEAAASFEAATERGGDFIRVCGAALRRDTGEAFFALGLNLPTVAMDGAELDRLLSAAAAARANTLRVLLPACRNGEAPPLNPWVPGKPPMVLRLEELWRLDRVMDLAQRCGLHVILALIDHAGFGQPEPDGHGWCWNPFNAANGGPCESPADFFTSPSAFNLFGSWLRYFVARYAAYSSLLAWELVHEFDRITLGAADADTEETVMGWHRRAASLLRLADAYDHPVSSSAWWFRGGYRTLSLPQITLAQTHYAMDTEPSADLAEECYYVAERRPKDYGKPYLLGAFGVHRGHSAEDRRAAEVGVHHGLWASAFALAAGAGLPVAEPSERLFQSLRVLGQFLRGGRLDTAAFFTEKYAEAGGQLAVYVMGSETESYVWIKNVAYNWQTVLRDRLVAPSRPVDLNLGWHPPGEYNVEVWDTREGLKRAERVKVQQKGLVVPVPGISRDLALRIDRV